MMRVLLKCWSASGLAMREDACKKNDFFSKVWWVTFLNVFMLKSFLWFSFTILKDIMLKVDLIITISILWNDFQTISWFL